MKKIVVGSLALSLLLFIGCKKENSGNKIIEKTEEKLVINNPDGSIDSTYSATSKTADGTIEKTDRYVAEDGSSALVTFLKSDKENSISIKSNNKVIKADLVEGSTDTYKNQDITIEAKDDSVTISQSGMIIALKKAKTSN